MRREKKYLGAVVALAATAHLFCCGAASAGYSFNETFDAPGVTPGTESPTGFDWENGWVTGDHPDSSTPAGWELIEQASSGSSLGQRPVTFWPHNDDTQVANVRGRPNAATAYAIRNLNTSLTSGNFTLVTAAYTVIGDISQSLRLTNADGTLNALQINFGAPQLGTAANDYFHAFQVGGGNVVVADDNTLTTGGAPLRWNINNFSSSSGDYIILSVDFDTIAHSGVVKITTVDALGTLRSTAPVNVALDPSVAGIERFSLATNPTGGNGSLLYYGNLSITDVVPEPSMLSLIGLAGVALVRRRASR